jgi:hypothetical protein
VNGSVPLWPPADGPGSLEDELDALVDVGGVEESVPLVVGDDEPDPVEPDDWLEPDEPELLEPEFDEPVGCDVVLDPVSGSTYC